MNLTLPSLKPEFSAAPDFVVPMSQEHWFALARKLWANGDEAHAAYAHLRGQELEIEKREAEQR